jgi:hypothetical protein
VDGPLTGAALSTRRQSITFRKPIKTNKTDENYNCRRPIISHQHQSTKQQSELAFNDDFSFPNLYNDIQSSPAP